MVSRNQQIAELEAIGFTFEKPESELSEPPLGVKENGRLEAIYALHKVAPEFVRENKEYLLTEGPEVIKELIIARLEEIPLQQFVTLKGCSSILIANLRRALEMGYSIEGYDWKEMTCSEWASTLTAINRGQDPKQWLKKGLDPQLIGVVSGYVAKGVPVDWLIHESFDFNQMKEIGDGYLEGLNVSVYAHAKYSSRKMYGIRCALRTLKELTEEET